MNKLNEYREKLLIEITGYRNEHKTQEDFINKPSVIGFAGFWTNRLYNKDVPNLFIWANALGHMDAAERALKRKDIATAFSYILQARRYYLVALKQYLTWREGIQGARVKMKGAILKASVLAIGSIRNACCHCTACTGYPRGCYSTGTGRTDDGQSDQRDRAGRQCIHGRSLYRRLYRSRTNGGGRNRSGNGPRKITKVILGKS